MWLVLRPGLPEGCAELNGAERDCTGSSTRQRWTGVTRRSEQSVRRTCNRPTGAERNGMAAVRLVYVLMEAGLGLSSCTVPLLTPWALISEADGCDGGMGWSPNDWWRSEGLTEV
jgi:hypothetical protein